MMSHRVFVLCACFDLNNSLNFYYLYVLIDGIINFFYLFVVICIDLYIMLVYILLPFMSQKNGEKRNQAREIA